MSTSHTEAELAKIRRSLESIDKSLKLMAQLMQPMAVRAENVNKENS